MENNDLFLISGEMASGKSASFMTLEDPEGVYFFNGEGKKLPFKHKFQEYQVTDPYQLYEGLQVAGEDPKCHTIIIESISFIMDMFVAVHIDGANNTQKMWGQYALFFRNLMLKWVAECPKNVIFTGHLESVLNEQESKIEKKVPVQGSLAKKGIEAFFSTVVSAKPMPLKKLEAYKNDMLNITEEEEILGFKYVFQTQLTKETVGEKIRSPRFMWSQQETFIDNDVNHVLKRLKEYYSED